MPSLEDLINEHELLALLAGALARAVDAEPPEFDQVLAARTRLSVALTLHLRREQEVIYPAIDGSDDIAAMHTARQFALELDTLSEDWEAYLREWSDDCVEQGWIAFRSETERMMARLMARIGREDAILYPLAFGKGRIPLRAA